MKVLVCGMHRSGNSAVARLFSVGTRMSLLDDPRWAIERGVLSYVDDRTLRNELAQFQVVKCPRMAEGLEQVASDFLPIGIIFVVRDPRDVWAAILEKVTTGRPTRMLSYERLGIDGSGVESFSLAFERYMEVLERAVSRADLPVHTVVYEEFFYARVASVERIADRLGLDFDPERVSSLAAMQLGPLSNKADLGGIRGVARWEDDLTRSDLDSLTAATDKYFQTIASITGARNSQPN